MGPQQSQDHGHKSGVSRGWKQGGDVGEGEKPAAEGLHWPRGEEGGCLLL